MMAKCIAAVLVMLGCCPAVAAPPVVRIATLDYPPYASPDAPALSPAVRLTSGAFAARGVHAEFDFLPWARAVKAMNERKYDGLLLIWPQEVAKFGMLPSEPLFYSVLGVFVRADSRKTITGPESLNGMRLGLVRDYGYPPELLTTGAQLDVVSDDLTNLRKLGAGRLDAALLEKSVGEYLLRHQLQGLCGRVVWSGKTLARLPLAIGFWDDALRLEFNAGLKEFKTGREYADIMASLDAPAVAPDARHGCAF